MIVEEQEVRQMVRRQRRRRIVTGLNVAVAVVLMATVVLLLNLLVSRFPCRIQLQTRSHHELSERTLGLLGGLTADINVIAFLASESALYDEVRVLLREYVYAADRFDGTTLTLEVVDPRRDIARTRDLAREYDVTTEDVIVFSCGGRRKYVEIQDLAKYEYGDKSNAAAEAHKLLQDTPVSGHAAIETKLIALVSSKDSTVTGKAWACRSLQQIGTEKAV